MTLYVLLNAVQLFTVLAITQTMKKSIARVRPQYATVAYESAPIVPIRMVELSKREIGTLSMPSGDAA
jgi:hypothetical protein